MASPPFDSAVARRTELQVQVAACRACAFEAAKLMLEYLETKRQTRS